MCMHMHTHVHICVCTCMYMPCIATLMLRNHHEWLTKKTRFRVPLGLVRNISNKNQVPIEYELFHSDSNMQHILHVCQWGRRDRENRNNSQINITANSDTITSQYRMGYNNKYGFYTCACFYICLTNKTWTHSSQITYWIHWSRAAISVSVYKISNCKKIKSIALLNLPTLLLRNVFQFVSYFCVNFVFTWQTDNTMSKFHCAVFDC